MSEIIVPPSEPPQVSTDAAFKIMIQFMSVGLKNVYEDADFLVKSVQPTFREFLEDGLEESGLLSDDTLKYKKEFCAGAMISSLAYMESGFIHPIEQDLLEVGSLEAQYEGLPGAFYARVATDFSLLRLITAAPREELGLGGGMYPSEYENIMSQGAGCARFMLQQAMFAA